MINKIIIALVFTLTSSLYATEIQLTVMLGEKISVFEINTVKFGNNLKYHSNQGEPRSRVLTEDDLQYLSKKISKINPVMENIQLCPRASVVLDVVDSKNVKSRYQTCLDKKSKEAEGLMHVFQLITRSL